jgi:hypothetical protein
MFSKQIKENHYASSRLHVKNVSQGPDEPTFDYSHAETTNEIVSPVGDLVVWRYQPCRNIQVLESYRDEPTNEYHQDETTDEIVSVTED